MPNFNLSVSLKDDIVAAAYRRINRTELYALGRFPLNHFQIQDGVVSPGNLEMLHSLTSTDNPQRIHTISKHTVLSLLLDRAMLPGEGLQRAVMVKLQLRHPIFLPRTTWNGTGAFGFKLPNDTDANLFDPDTAGLTSEQTVALVDWANEAVRQHRLCRLSMITVRTMLDGYLPTTAHLRARWPGLATLIEDRGWRQKIDTHTRGMMRYEMPPGVDSTKPYLSKQRMAIAEMLITQGDMLADYVADTTRPAAEIQWWEQLPKDVTE